MVLDRSQEVITLSAVNSLNNTSSQQDQSKPIVWKEFGVFLNQRVAVSKQSTQANSTKSILISRASSDKSFLSQNIKYKICNSCSRPIGIKSLSTHYTKCLEMKNKKDGDDSGKSMLKRKRGRGGALLDVEPSSVDSSRNTTPIPSSSNTVKPKKKYKKSQSQKEKEAANAAAAAAAASSSTPSQATSKKLPPAGPGKKKKQSKPKTVAKPKGPVDVEKQCGVPLPSGGYCARSLTCKTHSMGAKRAVLGRSAPYDLLLQQYQKRNQAKLAASNALAAQRLENAEFHGGSDPTGDDLMNNYNKIFDPDEETHLVLEGLSKNNPIPLERKIMLPVRNRHRFLASREFYANSLIISSNNSNNAANANAQNADQTLANQAISGSIGGLQGRCALINVDATASGEPSSTQAFSAIPGEMYQVRAPLKAILMTSQYNALQQQAFQQQVLKFQQQQQQQIMLMKQKQARALQQQQASVQVNQK